MVRNGGPYGEGVGGLDGGLVSAEAGEFVEGLAAVALGGVEVAVQEGEFGGGVEGGSGGGGLAGGEIVGGPEGLGFGFEVGNALGCEFEEGFEGLVGRGGGRGWRCRGGC